MKNSEPTISLIVFTGIVLGILGGCFLTLYKIIHVDVKEKIGVEIKRMQCYEFYDVPIACKE